MLDCVHAVRDKTDACVFCGDSPSPWTCTGQCLTPVSRVLVEPPEPPYKPGQVIPVTSLEEGERLCRQFEAAPLDGPRGAKPTDLSVAIKDDDGKARYDLIPPYPLNEVARVYAYGAQKYDDRNWEKGFRWGRLFAAAMRHCWAFWRGESLDPESGIHHLAHATFCLLALMEHDRCFPNLDDRSRLYDRRSLSTE